MLSLQVKNVGAHMTLCGNYFVLLPLVSQIMNMNISCLLYIYNMLWYGLYVSQILNVSADVSYLRQEIRKAQYSMEQEMEAKANLKIDLIDMTLLKAEQLLMSRVEARNYTEALESVKILRYIEMSTNPM